MRILSTKREQEPEVPGKAALDMSDAITSQAEVALGVARYAAIVEALEYATQVYGRLGAMAFDLECAGCKAIQLVSAPILGVQGICFRKNERAFIVFRGSNELQDWILNVLALPVGIPFLYSFRHLGFALAWWRVRHQIRAWVAQCGEASISLTLTGHSLGGAVAQLAALDLAGNYCIDNVITFGAPHFAWLGTADTYDKVPIADSDKHSLGDATQSVVNHRDLVAKVPIWPFREVGRLIYIDGQNQVYAGDEALNQRWNTSIADIEFLFSWEQNQAGFSLSYGMQQMPNWKDRVREIWLVIGPFQSILAPIVAYAFLCWQLARSGIDHVSAHYGTAFLPSSIDRLETRVKNSKDKGQRMWEAITYAILGGSILPLVLYSGWLIFKGTVLPALDQ